MFRALRVRVTLLAFLLLASLPAFATSNTVVISQIYGAGGNSGAVYNQDYVELFNNGTTAVSLNGWSLQYRSTTGTGVPNGVAPLPNVTLQPGEYYLFGASAASATVGAAVPADAQLTPYLNLAGGAGQVILSNSTATQPAPCVTSDPSIVDYVGYGTGTTCSEGNAPTGTISATLAAFRTKPCVDTDNNAADFSTAAPAPRTSATAFTPCSTGVATFALTSASANPTTVSIGGTTLLTARVTPATGSSGVAVTVDLSGIGGSSTQPLYDDATHGDTTASDNVFNFNATIAGSPSGTVTLKFTATDAQAHSATGTATLTIQATSAVTPIHTIQTGAPASVYLGKSVTTTGIVTAITSAGFYLEARDIDQDADPATSEGIFVLSGTNSSVIVGSELRVTGTVQLSSSTALYPATEIGGTVTVTPVTAGNPLPTAVVIKASDDSPTGGFGQFLKFQSMRFSIPNFITTAPTGGSLVEASETVTSTGDFYGVVAGVTRPFVEPGISVLETSLPAGATYCTATVTTNCVPRFDGNPENFYVQSLTLGGPALNVTSNQTITNLLGIVDFTTANGAQLLLDKTNPGTLGAPMTYIAVPAPAANEFTVGSMNIERFYSNVAATGAVTLTTEAYTRRLAKVSLLLRNVQGSPDIIGLQEVGTLQTLNDIAAKISADAIAAGQADPKYGTCLVTGNDSSGINTAFLYKTTSRVAFGDCTQFGKTTTFTNSTGAQATLNDRPPLVLHATINIAGYPAYPVTVISNHLKALTGVDDTSNTGATVRLKKEAQDEFLAALIQGYQAKGEHVVSVGDYNSFAFSDGYVDNLGVIKGTPAAASTVVVSTSSSYVPPTPALVDLESTIADPLQRYDYSYIGNAQTLDHIVVTQNMLAGAHIAFSHEDADFPLIQYNDATTPQSTSDHDGAVAFFPLLASGQTSSASLTPATQDFGAVVVGVASAAKAFVLTNTGNTSINVNSITATGDFAIAANPCPATLAAAATCTISVTFTPSTAGARSGSLIVTSSAVSNTTLTSTLTGSGVAANATVTLTPTTAAFGSVTYGATSSAQTFTLTNTGNTAATLTSIVTAGDFAKTTTCGATLAASATCTVAVTFTPTAVGARAGTLTVATSGSTSALSSSLTGTGAAQATLTPATATFTGVVGTGTTQAFTLTNTAGAALTVTSVAASGTGYTQTNTCGTSGSSLASGATCAITVTFNAIAAGSTSGTLTVVTALGAASSTLTSTLSGTATQPADFSLTPTSQSASTTAGNGASVNLTVTSLGGYAATLRVSCTGAPAGSSCTPASPTLTLVANGTSNLALKITTSRAAASGFAGGSAFSWLLALVAGFGACTLVFRRRRAVRIAGLLSALLVLALYTSGCGSSTPFAATPAGTYTYTITATDGTVSHTATYALTVQ